MITDNPYEKAGFASFDELYKTHYRGLKKCIERNIKQPDVADDLAQETFLTVVECIERYDPKRSSIWGWVYTIAKYKMLDYFRKQHTRHSLISKLMSVSEESSSPEKEMDNGERVGLLREYAQRNFSKADRKTLELLVQGYSPQEMSRKLGISEEAARQRRFRMRKKCNDYLHLCDKKNR